MTNHTNLESQSKPNWNAAHQRANKPQYPINSKASASPYSPAKAGKRKRSQQSGTIHHPKKDKASTGLKSSNANKPR